MRWYHSEMVSFSSCWNLQINSTNVSVRIMFLVRNTVNGDLGTFVDHVGYGDSQIGKTQN